jgi:hypothetical protein
MDDNIWEYPFGELDEDEEIFFRTSFDIKSFKQCAACPGGTL